MNLIFVYSSGDGCTYECTDTIPFEYSSIDDFQFMVLEKIKEAKELCIEQYGAKDAEVYYRNGNIKLFGFSDMNIGNLEDSIDNVYTLEDWFNKKKEIV